MDDIELLLTFAERGSEDAFRTLVDRHINLVYSVARQTVRDPQLAEEIVQTVFIILAQKATRLGQVKALSGWLYRTTRLAAIQALRNECRRREREEKFAQMDHTPSESVWEQVEPHLGEVMDRLSELDPIFSRCASSNPKVLRSWRLFWARARMRRACVSTAIINP